MFLNFFKSEVRIKHLIESSVMKIRHIGILLCSMAVTVVRLTTIDVKGDTAIAAQPIFPVKKFFNNEFQDDTAVNRYLCSKNAPGRCCDCSPDCMKYRTCCIDAFWNGETDLVMLDSYLRFLIKKRKETPEHTCQAVYSEAETVGHKTNYRMMVRNCKENVANKDDVSNCLQPVKTGALTNNLPVFGSDGTLYANAFCARCNLVFNFIRTQFKVVCKSSDDRFLLDIKGETRNNITLPRLCSKIHDVKIPKRYCRENESMDSELCASYYAPFGNHANYHCWKCSRNKESFSGSNTGIKKCEQPIEETRPDSFCINPVGIPYTISISSYTPWMRRYTDKHFACEVGQIFDIKEFKCIRIWCPMKYNLVGITCNSKNLTKPSDIRDLQDRKVILVFDTDLDTVRSKYLHIEHSRIIAYEGNAFLIYEFQSQPTLQFYKSLETKLSPFSYSLWEDDVNLIVSNQSYFPSLTLLRKLNLTEQIHPQHRICYRTTLLNVSNDFVYNNDSRVVITNNTRHRVEDIALWVLFVNSPRTSMEYLIVCEEYHLFSNCPRKLLAANTTVNVYDVLSHKHYLGTDEYSPDRYEPLGDGSFSVCITHAETSSNGRFPKYKILVSAEYYMSVIGMSISCVCYLWIILTYSAFPDLQTIPGFNTMFMCVSLLLSDVLFLVNLGVFKHKVACTAVAIAWHWSSLCGFAWTIVMSVDLALRFGSLSLPSNDRCTRRVARRCAFSFAVPALVVIVSSSLHTTSPSNIGYGFNGVCWITNFHARLGFYIVPAAFISLLTFLSLFYTLWKIYRSSRGSKNVRKSNKRVSFVKIALKLVVILGVTEFFGFIQIPGSVLSESEQVINVVFQFVYSILRSSRGILLWFAYILGEQVLKNYKTVFGTCCSSKV